MKSQKEEATFAVVHGRRKNSNTVEIRVYFSSERKQVYFSTGVKVDKEHWNNDSKLVMTTAPHFREKQKTINEVEDEIDFTIRQMKHEKIDITKKNFINTFKGKDTAKVKRSELVYLYCGNLLNESPIRASTKKAQRQTVNLIKDCCPLLTFDDINFTFANKWDKYLRNRYTNLNTIAGHHKTLKSFLNHAEAEGLLSTESLKNYKIFKAPRIKSTREAITPEQVIAIENLDYTPFSLLDNVRNMFLFVCYTGLRISDLTELERSHLTSDDTRGVLIVKEIHKLRHLNRTITLPIEKLFDGKPIELVNRYLNKYPDSNYIFPLRTHQTLNKYLKKVAHDAGLTPDLSFHYGRHTFLTILALKTRDIFVVMDYGGITSLNTAQGYIHMASKWLDKSLREIDWTTTS
jgi:integrase